MSGGDHGEHVQAMDMMKKATYGGCALVGVLCGVNMIIHFSHEHGHEEPAYPYRNIMNKGFPWSEKSCGLFDLDCKAKFRAMNR